MSGRRLKDRLHALARATIIYVPLLFVVMAVIIICLPDPIYIGPGIIFSFAICLVLLVAGLLPSYVVDLLERLLDS